MEKKIGISIYPEQSNFEKDKEYLELAKSLGYSVVFTSILHFIASPDAKVKAQQVLKALKYAKSIGFYTILDVEYESMKLLGITSTNMSVLVENGVDCIRLDSPSLPAEVSAFTHNKENINVQINMSNNDSFIDNIMDFQPITNNLSGCHNFYPLEDTALPFDFFMEANKKYLKYRLRTAAFIGSHSGTMTTAVGWKELPTIEMQRYMSVEAQAKLLFYTNEIDTILFGNAYATKEELEKVAAVNKYEITFDINPKNITPVEKQILEFNHFRRGDITDKFIRSTMTRVVFKNELIKKQNSKKTFNRGDVVIINSTDEKYKGECHIILEDGYVDKNGKYNYICSLKQEELWLLNFVKPWSHFRFNLI
ncbi:MupG family TIM beta-alpha barrel fold protein [Spiroplasma endosymbiont of Crioceris asparagi]|uniref:MupG family TIM beta-alpha barrel fold protein n=1 Tax=Spiroplasma endosymbiont of Crioceris asparagi TaxID=3066286 RepID=UPI0030D15656